MISTVFAVILASAIENQSRCMRWTWYGTWPNYTVVCLEWSKPPTKRK